MPGKPGDEKICAVCGRRIEWRKKWDPDWDGVKHCSAACRRAKLDATDEQLTRIMVGLLEARGSSSICPSEAAKAVDPSDWRSLIERARAAARRLAGSGLAEVTQSGAAVDPSTAKGPIRVRLKR